MGMIDVAERVQGLEQALEGFIRNVDRWSKDWRADLAQRNTKYDQMLAETRAEAAQRNAKYDQMLAESRAEAAQRNAKYDQMLAGHDRMLAEMKAEATQRNAKYDQMLAESRAEAAQRNAKYDQMLSGHDGMLADMKKTFNRQMGELSNRLGTVVEDIVAPNVRRIARECFECGRFREFSVRLVKTHPISLDREREFDVLYVGTDAAVWAEAKLTPRQDHLEDFVERLGEFAEYFPQYAGLRLIPVFASMNLAPSMVRFLTRRRVYALVMGEETMDLANFQEVQAAGEAR
jgi:hypothetical protein